MSGVAERFEAAAATLHVQVDSAGAPTFRLLAHTGDELTVTEARELVHELGCLLGVAAGIEARRTGAAT